MSLALRGGGGGGGVSTIQRVSFNLDQLICDSSERGGTFTPRPADKK